MSAQQKRDVRDEVASGEAGIVIGTHALLQDAVEFHRLGMVVVDEQHRFGVEQRDRLRAKAPAGITPHLLVMTATPIPRTVALTVYGDLETSTLRELPRGRQPITTNTIFIREKPGVARARVAADHRGGARPGGRPTSSPRASTRTTSPARATRTTGPGRRRSPSSSCSTRLQHGPLSGLRLGLMHGRLSADEKDAVMAAFRAGEIDVLVCTTVIEVGVDVPNATVMLVMDADRFGISQLHQLRGRIGRGAAPQPVSAGHHAARGVRRPGDAAEGGRRHAGRVRARRPRPAGAPRGRCAGPQPIRSADHAAVPVAGRASRDHRGGRGASARRSTSRTPLDPGMALLSAPFTDTDRVEYLDKS